MNCEHNTWCCPVCGKSALVEGLEVDQYLWAVLQQLTGTDFEEVTLDPNASWKPVPVKQDIPDVKDENQGNSMYTLAFDFMFSRHVNGSIFRAKYTIDSFNHSHLLPLRSSTSSSKAATGSEQCAWLREVKYTITNKERETGLGMM